MLFLTKASFLRLCELHTHEVVQSMQPVSQNENRRAEIWLKLETEDVTRKALEKVQNFEEREKVPIQQNYNNSST